MKPEHSAEFEEFAERVRRELLPMMKDSAVVVSIVPISKDDVDVKFAVELGLSVMLDKPILAVITAGTKIPEKLARVVDKFVELDRDNVAAGSERLEQAMSEMVVKFGLRKGQAT